MSHMTQTANPVTLLASPLGEEGHEVAKGCTRVRMIMILDVDVTAKRRHYNTHCPIGRYRNVRPEGPSILRTFSRGAADWRSGPRWSILSVLCPVHPFPLRGTSPRWEACHWIRGSRGSPMNPVPLPPPQFGGAAKGKRLNGQARRLTSPHLEVLCRTSTGDYKAPLCCELLMKGLLFRALFCPRLRGKSGAAG